MSNNEGLIKEGIAAFKSGDANRAFSLLTQAVRADPASEQGWLWLGKVCSVAAQKEYSFRRVLKINPENIEARLQLEKLLKKPDAAPPFSVEKTSVAALAETTNIQPPAPQPAAPATPSVTNEKQTVEGEKGKQPLPDQVAPADAPADTAPKTKKPRKLVSVFLGIVLLAALVYIVGNAYLFFSGKPTIGFPLRPSATLTLTPLPTQTETLTPSATPTATASPTPTSPPATPTARSTIVYSAIYEDAPCKFQEPAGILVNCGYVTVPQDRTDETSPTTRLAVVIYHSTAPNPAAEPVVFLQGGPGGEAVMLSANAFDILVKPFLAKRDFVTFDQRGTGLSKPALDCADLVTVYKQDIHGQVPASSRNMVYSNAFRSCHGFMSVGGIDLDSFITTASADDLKDIVTALGYTQVDLYGASYGTRLALVTMRDHPEIVKNVILDSVVPVEAKLFNDDPLRYGSALQALFDGCAAEPHCHAAYPDLETVFWDLVAQLDDQPVSVTAPLLTGGRITETVDGSTLIGVTLGLLKTTGLIASVPESIYRIQAGDYSTFVAMQSSLPYEFEGIKLGLYISVMCHEHILATTPQDLQTAMDSQHDIGRYFRLPFLGDAEELFNVCKVWDSVPPSPGENDPAVSDIPALIIEGKYDPATPPIYGQQVAANLSNSFYVEFPNQGHCPTIADTSGCAMKMAVEFLDAPDRAPDKSCLTGISAVNFIHAYSGNPPVQLTVEDELEFTAMMPVEWIKLSPGIYLRDNSPLDITQVAAFSTQLTVNELLGSLSSKLYGYGGFDSPPIQKGVRNANGLAWSLYTTTSYGRPVDLAMASSGQSGSFVVMLFCHKDEHDALYQTVYLPVIDSVYPKP